MLSDGKCTEPGAENRTVQTCIQRIFNSVFQVRVHHNTKQQPSVFHIRVHISASCHRAGEQRCGGGKATATSLHGFNGINLMMEEHTRFLISPPVTLCHNTSSRPLSRSTTLCWKPLLYSLRCPPPPLLCPPLFLEAFASQWWGGPVVPLFGTDR